MAFHIQALDPAQFQAFFEMEEDTLHAHGAVRVTADAKPGYPCRVSLQEAEVGETLLLLNYTHLDVPTPYAARHAIFVREGVSQAQPEPGEIPEVLRTRVLSLRAFDADGFMLDADVVSGADLGPKLTRMLKDVAVAWVDIHNAKQGCFAARARRA